MNLEKVKAWRANVGVPRLDTVFKFVDWLITELEKKQDVDIQSVLAWEAGERSAALACAELANNMFQDAFEENIPNVPDAEDVAKAIAKKYNLKGVE